MNEPPAERRKGRQARGELRLRPAAQQRTSSLCLLVGFRATRVSGPDDTFSGARNAFRGTLRCYGPAGGYTSFAAGGLCRAL